jgi:hypothetical protein
MGRNFKIANNLKVNYNIIYKVFLIIGIKFLRENFLYQVKIVTIFEFKYFYLLIYFIYFSAT